MAKSNSKSKRKLVGLVSESGQRVYTTKANSLQDKLVLKKYDKKLRKHVELPRPRKISVVTKSSQKSDNIFDFYIKLCGP